MTEAASPMRRVEPIVQAYMRRVRALRIFAAMEVVNRDATSSDWWAVTAAMVAWCPGCGEWQIEWTNHQSGNLEGIDDLEAAEVICAHRAACPGLDMLAGLSGV